MTERKAIQKLRESGRFTDTTYVEKEIVIPRDSVAIRTVTDTTTIRIVEKQGRATVTLIRTPQETIATATCDTVKVFYNEKVIVNDVQEANKYKLLFWLSIGFIVLTLLFGFISYKAYTMGARNEGKKWNKES